MINIQLKRGNADKEAPDIQDTMITSEQVAVLKGTAFLNDIWYLKRKRDITAPYKAGIRPRKLLLISDSQYALNSKARATGIKISIDKGIVSSSIESEEYMDFF